MIKHFNYLREIIQSTLILSERIDQLYEIELELSTIERRKIAKISEQTTDFLKTLESLQYQAREKRRTERKKAKSAANLDNSNKVKAKQGFFSGKPKEDSVPTS